MSLNIPTPNTIPFSVCVPTGRSSHCVDAEDLIIGGRRSCNSGMTPRLASVSITYAEKELTLSGTEVVASSSVWVGIEENLSAIWVGDPVGNCTRIYANPPSPTATIDEIINHLQSFSHRISSALDNLGGPNTGTTGSSVYTALVIIALAILWLITGGAVGS